ncbi:MAG TPA: tetratricopeptide repeat protein [Vicinamibacterales bacterium]
MRRRIAILAVAAMLAAVSVAAGQNSPRVAMLELEGWRAIKAGSFPVALDAFREAIRLDPQNARLRLGAGTAEYGQRHDPEAKAFLEQALELDPKLTHARAQLALVAKRQGDLTEAIRLYEIVVGEMPDDAALAETLARWKRERELHDRMQVEVGDFFTVSFEGVNDAGMAARALESLNRAYWRICSVLDAFPQRSVPVVLYSGQQFEDITRSPKWAAAAFDGIIRVPMRNAGERGDDLDRVLAHEFTHALIRSIATRGVPTWLNEGLAAALESEAPEAVANGISQLPRAPTLASLSGSFASLTGKEAQVAYAISAIAARRLLDEAGGPAVTNLLRDLGQGVQFEDAFLRRIQRSFADFQGQQPQ